jgi:hypothetical protein
MAQCVFCEATTGLNTQMVITLDAGKKVSVDICDVHAEDATAKTIKAAYIEKQGKTDALIEQLKLLGYNVTSMEQKGQLVIPTIKRPEPVVQQVPVSDFDPLEDLKGEDVVDTAVLDSKSSKGMASKGGSYSYMGGAASASVGGHASLDVTGIAANKLPPDQRALLLQARKGKAKMTVVEGRDGQPLLLPEKRVDGMGTTRLKIVKKEDDVRLQSRFKKMSLDTMHNNRVPDFARSGYQNTQANCPLCQGDCIVVNQGKEISCPKCGGVGFISVY